jgi:hypothetical protein
MSVTELQNNNCKSVTRVPEYTLLMTMSFLDCGRLSYMSVTVGPGA